MRRFHACPQQHEHIGMRWESGHVGDFTLEFEHLHRLPLLTSPQRRHFDGNRRSQPMAVINLSVHAEDEGQE